MIRRLPLLSAWLVLFTGSLQSAPPAAPKPAPPRVAGLLSNKDVEKLEASLRNLFVQQAPDPLFAKDYNWGHLKYVPRGLEWHGLKPQVQYAHKEDGVWRRVRVESVNLDETLILDIRNVRAKEKGPTLFDMYVSFPVKVFYDQQTWQNGHRLYAGSIRARLRVKVLLTCEMTTKMDFSKSFIPDIIFRLRVTNADLRYDDFVVEHAYGMGGDAAKGLGESAERWLQERHPELQQQLLEKANAAIIKAADTKEVRLGLGSAFGDKKTSTDPTQLLFKRP